MLKTILEIKDRKIMIIISSREFRANQKKYFDKIDAGEQVIVHRGKNKAYALTAITKDDVYFNAEMIDKIKESVQQAEDGDIVEITTFEEINTLLGL